MVPDICFKISNPSLGSLKLNGKLASGIQCLLTFFCCHFSSSAKHAHNGLPGAVQEVGAIRNRRGSSSTKGDDRIRLI